MRKLFILYITLFSIFSISAQNKILRYPALAEAGTWEHTIKKAKPKYGKHEVTVEFERDSGRKNTTVFIFENETQANSEGEAKYEAKEISLELSYSILNSFNIGRESKDILITFILDIRENPTRSLAAFVNSVYNSEYPNAIWKGDRFIDMVRESMESELGYVPDYNELKQYAIDNTFEEID